MPGSLFLTIESLSGLLKGDLATINHAVADQFVLCSLHLNDNSASAVSAPNNQGVLVACKILRVMLSSDSSAYLFQVEFAKPSASGSILAQALVGLDSMTNASSECHRSNIDAYLELTNERMKSVKPVTAISQEELVSFILGTDSASVSDQFNEKYAGFPIRLMTSQSILGRKAKGFALADIDELVSCAPYKETLPAFETKVHLKVRLETPLAMRYLDRAGALGRASFQLVTNDSLESIIQLDSCLDVSLNYLVQVEHTLDQFGFDYFFRHLDSYRANEPVVKTSLDINSMIKKCRADCENSSDLIQDLDVTLSGCMVLVHLIGSTSPEVDENNTVIAIINRVSYMTGDVSRSSVRCEDLEFEIEYYEKRGCTQIHRRHTVPGTLISHQALTAAQHFEILAIICNPQYCSLLKYTPPSLTPPACLTQNQLHDVFMTSSSLSSLNSKFRNRLVAFKRGDHVCLGSIVSFVEDKVYEFTPTVTMQHQLKVMGPNISDECIHFAQISNVQPSPLEQFEYHEYQANQRKKMGLGGINIKLTLDSNKGGVPNTPLPENVNFNQWILDCQRQLSRNDLLKRYVGHYVGVDPKLYSKTHIDAAVGKVCDISLSPQEAGTTNALQGYDLVLLIIEKSKSTLTVFVKRLSSQDVRVKEFNPYHEHLKAKLEQIIGAYPLIFSLNTPALQSDRAAQSHFHMDPREIYEIDDDLVSMPNVNARLMSTKVWLQSLLSQHLRFDAQGNPIAAEKNRHHSFIWPLQMRIAIALFKLAESGEAAFANRVKVVLASAGYLSSQVNGAGQAVSDTIRPNTFQRGRQLTQTTPPSIAVESRNKVRYWDWFDFYIYQGMKACRRKLLARRSDDVNETDSDDEMLQSAEKKDAYYKASHYEDYAWRKKRVNLLHQAGELLTRVVDAKEITQCFGHQYRLNNDSLSTSLLPPKGSLVNMRLYIEGTEAICVFLDGHCAASQDYGATFFRNAYTAGDGFMKQASRRIESNASASLSDMRQLFIDIDMLLRQNSTLDYNNLVIVPENKNGSRWRVSLTNTTRTNTSADQMPHNETTYYRPAERHMIIALGIKCNQIQYTGHLKKLVLIQSLLRTQKQLFLPIYRLDSKRNQLEEIVIGEMELAQLQLTKQVVPHTRGLQIDMPDTYLQKLMQQGGISASELSHAMSLAESSPGLAEITNIMMMSLNLNEATDTISVYDEKRRSLEEIRLLDNMHLVFPGNFETGNQNAYRPELRFSEADIRQIRSSVVLKKVYQTIMFENLKKMIGIDFNQRVGRQFSLEKASLYDLHELHKGTPNTHAKKIDYARVLTRVYRSLKCLELVDKTRIDAVFREILTRFPSMKLDVALSDSSASGTHSTNHSSGLYSHGHRNTASHMNNALIDHDDTKSCATGVSNVDTTQMHFGILPFGTGNRGARVNNHLNDDDTKSCASGYTVMNSSLGKYNQPHRGL